MAVYQIEGPDSRTYELEGPEGATDEQIQRVAARMWKEGKLQIPPPAPEAKGIKETRTLADDLLRQGGLTVRAAVEGAANLGGIVSDPLAAGANYLFGTNLEPLGQTVSRGLTELGVPQPATPLENVVQQGSQMMVGGAAQAKAAQALSKLATNPATANALATMGSNVWQQVTGGAGAGVGAETAKQMGGGELAQMGAGLVGGVVGGYHPSMVKPAALQAAEDAKIPVMTTDVFPPESGVGKFFLQGVPEKIPLFGTSGPRAAQQQKRIDAMKTLFDEYGVAPGRPIPDEAVVKDFNATRGTQLAKLADKKQYVIQGLSVEEVPVNKTLATIDAEISDLQEMDNPSPAIEEAIGILQRYRQTFQGKTLDVIEKNRAVLGEEFTSESLATIKGEGKKAVNNIYYAINSDMGDFIKTKGGRKAYGDWKSANQELSAMADDLEKAAVKSVFDKGEITPEEVERLIFSKKPSDVATLYRTLSPTGKQNARTAVIQHLANAAEGTTENGSKFISPERYVSEVKRIQPSISTLFEGKQRQALDGLTRALEYTGHAATATRLPATGYQASFYAVPYLVGNWVSGVGIPAVLGVAGAGFAGRAMESKLVRNLLISLSQTKKGSIQEDLMAKRLIAAIVAAQANNKE